jgi:hypothetical protein
MSGPIVPLSLMSKSKVLMENLKFEFRCSVSPLPTQIWLRLVRYRLVPVVVVALLVLLYLFLKKDFALPAE